jgi:hypothetical protein
MNATIEIVPSVLDRIRKTLVGLKMPRALEVLDQAVRQLERGEGCHFSSAVWPPSTTLFLEKNLIRTGLLEMAMRWSPNLSRHRSHAKRNARPDRRFSSIRMAQRRRRCTNTMDGFWWLIKLDVVIHNTTIRS